MKKKTLIILIIVIQFLVIVYLSIFSILKMVEARRQELQTKESEHETQKIYEVNMKLNEQIMLLQQDLEKCRQNK